MFRKPMKLAFRKTKRCIMPILKTSTCVCMYGKGPGPYGNDTYPHPQVQGLYDLPPSRIPLLIPPPFPPLPLCSANAIQLTVRSTPRPIVCPPDRPPARPSARKSLFRPPVRPPDRPSARPTARLTVRPPARPSARPPDRPPARPTR